MRYKRRRTGLYRLSKLPDRAPPGFVASARTRREAGAQRLEPLRALFHRASYERSYHQVSRPACVWRLDVPQEYEYATESRSNFGNSDYHALQLNLTSSPRCSADGRITDTIAGSNRVIVVAWQLIGNRRFWTRSALIYSNDMRIQGRLLVSILPLAALSYAQNIAGTIT